MSDPKAVKINDQYEHIPNSGKEWRILDSDLEHEEFQVPKKFAPLPEVAVELLEYISEKQEIALKAGYSIGRESMHIELRKLLGAAPITDQSS